ncbi:MAG: DJ-1/PfpI family protein [Neisseriaceae bacterium]|nr:DJ-1/PfpI family protein [Neisseriaceae bacterium]MBP6862184.1 DJ-1/PfpI family protein [Neisseriaceae bacterium]
MGIKTAVFFVLPGYAEWESAYLASRLNRDEQWQVKTASLTAGVCESMGGFKTVVDYGLADLPAQIDLLVLVGGTGWGIDSADLNALIEQCLAQGTVVGAICGAVDYLAKNGHLNQHQHTGNALFLWQGYEQYQNQAGFQAQQVVSDRRLVTANGTAAIAFSAEVLRLLKPEAAPHITSEHALFQLGYYAYKDQYGDPYA